MGGRVLPPRVHDGLSYDERQIAPKPSKMAPLFSRASDEWSTPELLFNALDAEFDFALDVAASEDNHKCPLWLGPTNIASNYRDGLSFPWRLLLQNTTCAAWMNPPYSKVGPFMKKAAEQTYQGGCTVVALVPSRTDTKWWHAHVWDNEKHRPRPGIEIRYIKGRLKFGDSKNSAPFPSVVIVMRPVESK